MTLRLQESRGKRGSTTREGHWPTPRMVKGRVFSVNEKLTRTAYMSAGTGAQSDVDNSHLVRTTDIDALGVKKERGLEAGRRRGTPVARRITIGG